MPTRLGVHRIKAGHNPTSSAATYDLLLGTASAIGRAGALLVVAFSGGMLSGLALLVQGYTMTGERRARRSAAELVAVMSRFVIADFKLLITSAGMAILMSAPLYAGLLMLLQRIAFAAVSPKVGEIEDSIRTMFTFGMMLTIPAWLSAAIATSRLRRRRERYSLAEIARRSWPHFLIMILWVGLATTAVLWILARPRFHAEQVTYGMSFLGPLDLLIFSMSEPAPKGHVIAVFISAIFLMICFAFLLRSAVVANALRDPQGARPSLAAQAAPYWIAISLSALVAGFIYVLMGLLAAVVVASFIGLGSLFPDLPGIHLYASAQSLVVPAIALVSAAGYVVLGYCLCVLSTAAGLAIHYPSGCRSPVETLH